MNTNYKKIKSFPGACKVLGLNAADLLKQWTANGDTKDEVAYKQLKIFAKAINGDWIPRMGDSDQRKYYPYFWVSPGGSGFSDSSYYCFFNGSSVGSRLCYETAEQAMHAAKYGEKMYMDYHL